MSHPRVPFEWFWSVFVPVGVRKFFGKYSVGCKGDTFMLVGRYSHSIDAKGRLFIPAKFREELGYSFFVTKGIDKCLFVFAAESFAELGRKFKSIALTDRKAQVFLRKLFANAVECVPDKQGRIGIPAHLREAAGLSNEVTAIGVLSRVELWNPEAWQEYEANDEGYEDILEALTEQDDLWKDT